MEQVEKPGRWQQHATRVIFFIGGFGAASWAPLIPFLKARLQIDEGVLGMLLLCIGAGSLFTMPFAGRTAARFGCRRVLSVVACAYALLLVLLGAAASFWLAVPALVTFGAVMGILDVTVNIQAVMVEQAAGHRLMSGFHALWSVGGFAGAGLFGVWMSLGLTPLQTAVCAAGLMLILLGAFGRYLLPYGGEKPAGGTLFARPKGIVAFVGIICCIAFLAEGAIMDWSGVFLTTLKGMDLSKAGTGFAVFSAAMLVMRLTGDWLVPRLGSRRIVLGGSALSVLGFLLVIFSSGALPLYLGFFAIGMGCANIVPVFYSVLGRQQDMSVNMAVSAVSTLGYMGILMGPAVIGFVAHQTSLYISFGLLAALVVVQMLIARYVYRTVV